MTKIEELTTTAIEEVRAHLLKKHLTMTSERASERANNNVADAIEMVRSQVTLRKEFRAKIPARSESEKKEDLDYLASFFETFGVTEKTADAIVKEMYTN